MTDIVQFAVDALLLAGGLLLLRKSRKAPPKTDLLASHDEVVKARSTTLRARVALDEVKRTQADILARLERLEK